MDVRRTYGILQMTHVLLHIEITAIVRPDCACVREMRWISRQTMRLYARAETAMMQMWHIAR